VAEEVAGFINRWLSGDIYAQVNTQINTQINTQGVNNVKQCA
jgi:hypothetical protein